MNGSDKQPLLYEEASRDNPAFTPSHVSLPPRHHGEDNRDTQDVRALSQDEPDSGNGRTRAHQSGDRTKEALSEYSGVPLDRVEQIHCYTRTQITPEPHNRIAPSGVDSDPELDRITPLPDIIQSGTVRSPSVSTADLAEGRCSLPPGARAPSTISTASQWTYDSEVSASGRSMLSDSYSIDSMTMRPRRRQRAEPTFESLMSSVRSGSVMVSTGVYARRWYILAVFSLYSFLQGGLVDVYTVIAQSAEPAFGWSDAQTSLMQYWIYACYPVALFPSCWLVDAKGLRVTVIVGALITFLGTLVRCLSVTPPYVTWFAHLGNIFVGSSGPIAMVLGPVVSSVWFPPHQRTTATAVATISGFAGASACFVVGPNIVEVPVTSGNHTSIGSVLHGNSSPTHYTNIAAIKQEILYVRYTECALVGVALLLLIIYFPARPPRPPSISASLDKISLGAGLLSLFRRENARFWLVCLTYTLSGGLYDIWSALLDVNLKQYGVSEKEAGWTACIAVFVGSMFAVIIGLISDVLSGRMKTFSVLLMVALVVSSLWLALICIFKEHVPYFDVQLYGAVVLQGIGVNGPIPLFYEMAIESSYPVSENVTSGMMSLAYNLFPLLFLALFWIPSIGTAWMNWFYVGSACCCVPLIVCFRERFRRSEVDSLTLVTTVN